MKQLLRYIMIFIFFIASTIAIHTIKAPQRLPSEGLDGFRVACMPAHIAVATNADKKLIPYAQLAHTTAEKQRCYFRFLPSDITCIPKAVASRQPVSSCPQFPVIDGTPDKHCYLLNKKYIPLSEELKKKPAVSASTYVTDKNVIGKKTWQEVRDILLQGK